MIVVAIATSASCRLRPGRNPYAIPEEVFLVNRIQHFDHRALEDIVLRHGNPQGGCLPFDFST